MMPGLSVQRLLSGRPGGFIRPTGKGSEVLFAGMGIVPSTLLTSLLAWAHYPHFTDIKTEAEGG